MLATLERRHIAALRSGHCLNTKGSHTVAAYGPPAGRGAALRAESRTRQLRLRQPNRLSGTAAGASSIVD